MNLMHGRRWSGLLCVVILGSVFALANNVTAQRKSEPFDGILDEHPAIRYADAPTTDRVSVLADALSSGAASLQHTGPSGYLRSLLSALEISPESQLLIYSKTGIQRAATSPRNPRALYFDDAVVIGYIPGAQYIEIASHDSKQGVIFYTIDQTVTTAPQVSRRTNCLTCHVSGSTVDVPGLITRSNFTNATGELIPQLGFHIVDHRTPLSQRWGGWFVTGRYDLAPYGGVTHMGNVATTLHPVTAAAAGTSNEIFHRWLSTDATALGYPSHESDIAALMVFDHQARAINLLTRLHWEARVAAHEGRLDTNAAPLRDLIVELVDYFVFVDEVPPPARLTPRPEFAKRFEAAGPRDSHGRSLRELDLNSRLLKYSCSYMISSDAFDALPQAVKDAVYRRLLVVLRDPSGKYQHLADHRDVILQLLRATRRDRSPAAMLESPLPIHLPLHRGEGRHHRDHTTRR